MEIDKMPDDHKIDPNLAKKELVNRQKSALKQQELQKKVLNDTLISRFMAVLIANLDKRFIKNRYLKTLIEKLFSTILRRRRGRSRLIETAAAEVLAQRQQAEDRVPTMFPKDENKPLLFSKQSQNKTSAEVSLKGPEDTSRSKRRWWPSPFKGN